MWDNSYIPCLFLIGKLRFACCERKIWSNIEVSKYFDHNGVRTHNQFVRKRTVNHLTKTGLNITLNDWALLWVLIYTVNLTVCYYHVTYAFQSESTLYSCLNVKELLARNRGDIWRLSDSNGIRTHNHLVCKRTLTSLGKLLRISLRTKWLWVRIPLLSLKLQILRLFQVRSSLTFRQLEGVDSLWNTYVTLLFSPFPTSRWKFSLVSGGICTYTPRLFILYGPDMREFT